MLAALIALHAVLAPTPEPLPAPPPALGIALNISPSTPPATRQAVLDAVRRTGASFFALEVSWPAAEPSPGKYSVAEVTRTARLLRQSGAVLLLDLSLVTEVSRDVPADLSETAFDDAKLSLRLGRLLDALLPALRDCQTLSLGRGADAYFRSRPEELKAFRRLFEGAVEFLQKRAPHLLVGVTTAAPTESPAPEVAAALHQRSSVLLYAYSPFERATPYRQRGPGALDDDWKRLLKGAAGRPVAFPAVSYSSSAENGSSPERQAEFVRRLRSFLGRADGRALLFARYVSLRDPGPEAVPAEDGASEEARRRRAFLLHRGLQEADGKPKPAWREWLRAAPGMKR